MHIYASIPGMFHPPLGPAAPFSLFMNYAVRLRTIVEGLDVATFANLVDNCLWHHLPAVEWVYMEK